MAEAVAVLTVGHLSPREF